MPCALSEQTDRIVECVGAGTGAELEGDKTAMVHTLSTTLRVREEEAKTLASQKEAAEKAQHAAVSLVDAKVTEIEQVGEQERERVID